MRKKNERKKKFKYNPRTEDQVKKRSQQASTNRDTYLNREYSLFKPQPNNNCIRILPATSEDAQHYGIDIFIHNNIGADNSAYLCRKAMLDEHCTICEEKKEAESEGDVDYAKELRVTKRVLVWLINRDEEKEGVRLWAMPWTIDRDISKLSIDKRGGGVLNIDNPDEGYDVEFEYEAPTQGSPGKYSAISIARNKSELGKEDWLDFAIENPLEDCLVYFEDDYIKSVHHCKEDEKEQEDEKKDEKEIEKEEREVAANSKYNKKDIENMMRSELESLAESLGFDEKEIKDCKTAQLRKELCEELELEESPEERAKRLDSE